LYNDDMAEAADGEKLFKIEPKKTFCIQPASPKKDFVITSDSAIVPLPGTYREVLFTHQRNGYDCGPCLVLNTLSVLNASTNYTSISDVRGTVNFSRAAQHLQICRDNQWLTTHDVADALEQRGIAVEPFSVKSAPQESDLKASLEQRISRGEQFVVYSGTERHFKGIYFDGNTYSLLDSMRESISRVSRDEVNRLITSAKTSDRPETVAIASRRVSR
jgi:hypothetical protein